MAEHARLPLIDLDAVPGGPVTPDLFRTHENIPLVNASTDSEPNVMTHARP